MSKPIQYESGEYINGFKFILEAEKHGKERAGLFECPKCSLEFECIIKDIKQNKRSSCGCTKKLPIKHGMSGTPLSVLLKNMKSRCYNHNNKMFYRYGGRGITICKEWLSDSNLFFEWAANNGYKQGLQIDRIDNNGNYEPSNCRFVSQLENSRNKEQRMKYGFIGVFAHSGGGFTCRAGHKYIGWYKQAKDAAIARDAFIIENSLNYELNFK